MDLDELISKAKSGDIESYGLAVSEPQGRLSAFIAAWCADASQIDDLAQRTFIWAYEHLDQYEPGTRFYAWLKAIAGNMLLSELEFQRREASNRRRYLAHMQATDCIEKLARKSDAMDADPAEALKACMDSLPPESRLLIARRYERPEPIASIARDLAKTETSVKVALFRIRQKLRKCIEGRLATARR